MILVIEDNESERTLLRKMLESEGFTVCEAGDGEAGLAQFEAQRPTLVICDLMMPVKNGFETIPAIRDRAPDMPIIAISGFLFGVDQAAMRENLGVAALVEKPFRKAHLLDVVRQVTAVGR